MIGRDMSGNRNSGDVGASHFSSSPANRNPSVPSGPSSSSGSSPLLDANRQRPGYSYNMSSMKKVSLDTMWKTLEPGLQAVFQMREMNKKLYMEHYSAVYGYCVSIPSPSLGEGNDQDMAGSNGLQTRPTPAKKRTPQAGAGGQSLATGLPSSASSPSHQAAWVGMELYKKLREFVRDYLIEILQEIKGHHGEELLNLYCKLWNNFRFSSRVANGICSYLNRHWVKRENDEGRHKDIYHIYGLCLVQWREHVFAALEQQLSRALLDLMNCDRNGETINSQLVRQIVDNFVELGVTSEAEDELFRKGEKEGKSAGLQVYRAAFEALFLVETQSYYNQESLQFLASNPVNEYIKKVQTRLAEEEVRATKYLHESTTPLLKKTLEDVLIIRHMDVFHAEFDHLLAEEKIPELASMYTLLCRVPSRVEELYRLVEAHIKNHGAMSMSRNVEQLVSDPRAFVMAILEVYDRSHKLITGAFKGDAGFTTAMDKAFGLLVNNNAVSAATKTTSKVSELLARYCDAVLKKSTRNPDDAELDESLNRVMIIFRYVEEKDVFQKYYSKMLAKRLVQGLSASDDFEATMISKLKAACGFEYTSKLQRMFQDMGLSKDLNDQFRTHLENNRSNLEYEFTVQILSTGAWPFSERTSLTLPPQLERPVTVFRDFYQGKYSGRKLTWLYNLSRCELSTNCFKNKYILQVSTYQAAVLLIFNDVETSCSVEQMGLLTNCEQPFLNQVLASLLKSKILMINGDQGALEGPSDPSAADLDGQENTQEKDIELSTQTHIFLNPAFRSKKLRINLNVPMRAEKQVEEEATSRVIEEDRKLLIQASIVRIMKMRKQLRHQQLIGETMQMLANRFKPAVLLIKKCIEILIQKEYMKRDEENKDFYTYIA